MPTMNGLGTTRAARAAARKKVRDVKTTEEKMRSQFDEWLGNPMRLAIHHQAQSLADVSSTLLGRCHDSATELNELKQRVSHIEVTMERLIREQVSTVVGLFREENERAHTDLSRQIAEVSRVDQTLKDMIVREQEARRVDYSAFEESATQRLDNLELAVQDTDESRREILKLKVDFGELCQSETRRETYARHLESVIKDIEERVWPWRPKMDRGNSPVTEERLTRCERSPTPDRSSDRCHSGGPEDRMSARQHSPSPDRMMPRQPFGTEDSGRAGRTMLPESGPMVHKATLCPSTRLPSDGLMSACTSTWPTPPSSRPSSAKHRRVSGVSLASSVKPTSPTSRPSSACFRGRDTGRINQAPVAGSGSAVAKQGRPLSASSTRSIR